MKYLPFYLSKINSQDKRMNKQIRQQNIVLYFHYGNLYWRHYSNEKNNVSMLLWQMRPNNKLNFTETKLKKKKVWL